MKMANIFRSIGRFLYVILVLSYPLIEKVGIAYCLWQLVLTLVYWDDPTRHPGYHFIGAYILLAALLVMVAEGGDEEKTNRGSIQKNHR